MAEPPFLPLATGRLLLRRLEPLDVPAIERYAGDEDVARMTARIPHPYPPGMAAAWVAETHRQMAGGLGWQLAVATLADGALVGAIGLEKDEADAAAELGYWIGRPHWGRGYATEAARRLIAFGFQEGGLREVRAHCMAVNAASRRVLEKLGMAFQGPATVEARGRNVEVRTYALDVAAWRVAQARP